MKHLKRINELFDDEFQKDLHEIPYLRGEITPQSLSSGENILQKGDRTLNQLVHSCPWIVELGYRRSGSILSIGFSDTIRHTAKDEVFFYLNIEIVEFTNNIYNINFSAKAIGNGRDIYNESIRKQQLNVNDLIEFMNKTCYPLVVDFNNYLTKMFSKSPVSYTNKFIRPFNPKHN